MASDLEVEREGQVAAALASLADGCRTAADVAAKLLTAGCKGERASCYTCPITEWLTRNLPDADRLDLSVDGNDVTACWRDLGSLDRGPGVLPDYEIELPPVPLPLILGRFVAAFDEGDVFPELEQAATL
jgi:hypothetical protein